MTTVGTLRVEQYGSGSPAIIFIPELSCGSWVWCSAVRVYAKTHSVYVLTLAGFDGLPAPSRPALDSADASLLELVKQPGMNRPILVGHSLGGFLALRFGTEHADLVRAIVAVDGTPVLLHNLIALSALSSTRPQAVVNTDDGGGSFGLWINNGAASGDGDMYLAMTAGTNIAVTMAPAGSPAQYNSILAPSAHAPNGDCRAVVNGYSNDVTTGGATNELMAIYDYCDSGGKYEGAFPMNSMFLANYVRVFSNNNQTPEYVVETIKGGDGAWHMIIFNETTQVWDQYYQSASGQNANLITVGQRGWAELKTSLRGGTSCPTSSTQFGVSGIRVHLASNTWVKLDGTNSPPLYKGGVVSKSESYYTMTWEFALGRRQKRDAQRAWLTEARQFSIRCGSTDPVPGNTSVDAIRMLYSSHF